MLLKKILYIFLLFFFLHLKAQTTDEVLFTVDDEPVYTSEFLRVYNKNLDLVQDESQKNLDAYLTLFTNYKLKLKEARALGLDKKASYLRELSSYKEQLAKRYITEPNVTENIVKEAYDRISNEVKAAHILVRLPENASSEDTLVAYNNIIKLRERALTEGFETVRKSVHNGQTIFGENLGYFSAFKMVYNFESSAFNTPVDAISEPFKTRFGYHILKVYDKRESRGERTVAHIMIGLKTGDSINKDAETRIQEIYKKLSQGEDFESLAKQFSDDKNSAIKGGLLPPFSSGQLISQEFEDEAFNLNGIGAISQPFKTEFGWHIIKLYDIKPIPPFEEIKQELEIKVKRDERSQLIDDVQLNKLKIHYNISNEQAALPYFTRIINDTYFKRSWQLPIDFQADIPLLKIGNKQFTYKDFGDFLVKTQKNVPANTPLDVLVENKYNSFLHENLIQYREDNLENENEEFAFIVSEYRDGLLLFDLMETTIWNKAKADTLGLQQFYNTHKADYVLPERIDAVVASSQKEASIKKVSKLLEKGMTIDKIKTLINTNNDIKVIFTSEIMDKEHQAIPRDFLFNKGVSKIYYHLSNYTVVLVKDILPSRVMALDEAKGAVIADFQEFKEVEWLNSLSKKYKIVVNQDVLINLKNQIKN